MADANIFLLLNQLMNILPDTYFKKEFFEWISLTWQCALILEHDDFLNTDILQGSVAT